MGYRENVGQSPGRFGLSARLLSNSFSYMMVQLHDVCIGGTGGSDSDLRGIGTA